MSAIVVENLGKRYLINHQVKQDTLRDAFVHGARRMWSRIRRAPVMDEEEFWALSDLSFEVGTGEVMGIVGRNGAGKSTLLKVLSRITEPTTGRIAMQGRIASLLEVGTGFHPELSGRENIHLNGAILGMNRTEIRRKFDQIVDFSGVERFLDTPVKRYSSGMYVRLAFAVAAHLEPEILIIDEVLAVGDAEFQRKCIGKMGEVAGEGRTVLFVSHNVAAIRALCTSAILLERGHLKTRGSVAQVLADYAAPVVGGSTRFQAAGPAPDHPSLLTARLVGMVEDARYDLNRPLAIEMTINTCGNPNLVVSLHMHDEELNEVVQTSSQFATSRPPAGQATMTVRVELPPRVLNVGDYTCTLVTAEHNIAIYESLEGVLAFTAIDSEFVGPGRAGDWHGVSSPRLANWTWPS